MAVVKKLKELAKVTLPVQETRSSSAPVPAAKTTPGLTAEQLIRELQTAKRSAS